MFGQITLHCSNYLVDEHEHLYYVLPPCLTHLILSKLKHTFCFFFLVMPLPVGTVPELPLAGPVKVVKVVEAQTLRHLVV